MPYLIGVLLALANIFGARAVGMDRDRAFYPLVLSVIASYYVLFAVMGATLGVAMGEVAIMLLFLVIVGVGFRTNLWWIVAGLVAHGLMDAVHGQLIVNKGVPTWWPAFCASYDLAAGAVLALFLTARGKRGALIAAEVSNA